jgi:hypothetical protein
VPYVIFHSFYISKSRREKRAQQQQQRAAAGKKLNNAKLLNPNHGKRN